jgi:hypothetical protein
MTKIKYFLTLLIVFSIGLPTFSIIGLKKQQSPIISDANRAIEIPFDRINLKQSITLESSGLALWDGLDWRQLPFDLISSQDNLEEHNQDLNNSASTSSEILPTPKKDIIRFFIPYIKSQSCTDPPWWSLAQQYNLNQRIKFSLKSSFNNELEIYFYFGNSPLPDFPYQLMVDIPYGTKTQYPDVNSSVTEKNQPIEYFALNEQTNIELADKYQSGGGQGASLKTVYDRGDFFDHHEFRNTGNTPQVRTQYLAPRDYINGEKLVVTGTAHGDDCTRLLKIKLNGVLLENVYVDDYFYYSWSQSSIHSYLDNDYGENELEITLTTWTNDWYWRVDGYFTSYYTAEKHFNTQRSLFADDNNKYKFYYTGQSVQEFAVDVPRGITSATLKIYGKDYDDWSRVLKVYVNGEQVLYAYIGSAGGTKDFSKSISVTNKAKYEDELKIGIVITTYDPYQEDNYWLIYGRLLTNARMDPFPDEPHRGNMWDSTFNTFKTESVSLWHTTNSNENFFLGDFDYYVRSKCTDDTSLFWGMHYYIPEEAVDALDDEYCSGAYDFDSIRCDVYAELTSSGWEGGYVDFESYYGSPTDNGEDEENMGSLLVDTTLDFANIWASVSGSPASALFPAFNLLKRWAKFLTRSNQVDDKATTNPADSSAIIDFRVKEDEGSLGRLGKWDVLINTGTKTFSTSITIKIYLYYWKMTIDWTGWHYTLHSLYLGKAIISHSVTIEIPY